VQQFFLQLLLASLFIPIVCFCVFIMAEAMPQCGPLRDAACVLAELGPNVSCVDVPEHDVPAGECRCGGPCAVYNVSCDDERSNYESFTDYFLPSDLGAVDVKDTALGLASGATKDGDVLETATEQVARCTARCWVKTVIVSLVNVPMLNVVGGILIVFLRFSRAQSKRLANELQLVRQQLAQEHLDKIRLLRVAGITLD